MKYLFFIILLSSCAPSGKEHIRKDNNTKPSEDYRVVVIDGCEYIEVENGIPEDRIYSLTHKGNCNNSIHPEHTRQ